MGWVGGWWGKPDLHLVCLPPLWESQGCGLGEGRVGEWEREEGKEGVGEVEGVGCTHCIGPGLLYGLLPACVGVAGLQVEGAGGVEGVREVLDSEMPSRDPAQRYYGWFTVLDSPERVSGGLIFCIVLMI